MRVETLEYIGMVEAKEVAYNVFLATDEVIVLKPDLGGVLGRIGLTSSVQEDAFQLWDFS